MSHYSVAVHSGFYQCKILFNKHGVGKMEFLLMYEFYRAGSDVKINIDAITKTG